MYKSILSKQTRRNGGKETLLSAAKQFVVIVFTHQSKSVSIAVQRHLHCLQVYVYMYAVHMDHPQHD